MAGTKKTWVELFAMRLQKARLAAGFESRREAASALDVRFGSLVSWESGRRVPSAQAVATLARGYSISADKLLGMRRAS